MMTKAEKEFITPRLLKILNQEASGTDINEILTYMGHINVSKYSIEEAQSYLNELCEQRKVKKRGDKYFTIN